MKKLTRRQFVTVAGLAVAPFAFPVPGLIAAGANEKVRLGGIGCGGRGGELLNAFSRLDNVDIVALADPESLNLNAKKEKFGVSKTFIDFRKLLDDPNIDAVFVATCNHWHCLAAIWAMQAGKHVYVEKPLSHSPWEGMQVVHAARKYKKICQVGTQQRSDPMQSEIKNFLHEDKVLGKILSCRVNRYGVRKPIGKRDTPLEMPATVDYNLWLGPAQDQPIYRDNLHYDWHWDWNTGSGEMGNWGVHVMDDVRNNVLLDKPIRPLHILGGGGRVIYNDAGQTPNVHFVWFDTGSIPVVLGLSNLPEVPGSKSAGKHPGPGSGYVVYCEGGTLWGQRGKAIAYDRDEKVVQQFKGDNGRGHQKNFIDAVVAGDAKLLNAEVAVGNASSDWCNLANIAYRAGKPFTAADAAVLNGKTAGRWEELLNDTQLLLAGNNLGLTSSEIKLSPLLELAADRCQFVGDNAEEANRYIKRQYRKPFVVPEV
ncbi:MAG: Gfo/Idh/MocA family oxidoreductase [Thermoguttaceae bacterium]|nr:Gfo/Idh/MocA family oxidoreductase [Thermoguttaceae bacterium]